jgi:hypothetical protein
MLASVNTHLQSNNRAEREEFPFTRQSTVTPWSGQHQTSRYSQSVEQEKDQTSSMHHIGTRMRQQIECISRTSQYAGDPKPLCSCPFSVHSILPITNGMSPSYYVEQGYCPVEFRSIFRFQSIEEVESTHFGTRVMPKESIRAARSSTCASTLYAFVRLMSRALEGLGSCSKP